MTYPPVASILDPLLRLHGLAAVLLIFVIPALEASAFLGFVFPGELAVLLGGVLAYQGRVPLWAALVAAILGAVVGDSIGYWVGREWGRSILRGTIGHLPWSRDHLEKNLDRAREYLRRRGARAVVVGRFTTGLRVTVPGLAGMSDMPYGRFLAANAAGGAIWGTAFVLIGYFGGAAWRRVEATASKAGLVVLGAVLVSLVALRLWRARGGIHRRIVGWPPVAWISGLFPRQVAWMGRRVGPGPRGFWLTLVCVFGALCAWSFGGLTQDVVAHDEMATVDPHVETWVVAHRVGWLTSAMKGVTWLGSTAVLIPLAVAVGALFLWRRRDWRPAALLGAAIGGSIALYDIAKPWVGRPRPPAADRIGVAVSGWSFPSGHAAQAVAVWAMLAVIFGASGGLRRILVWIGAVLVVLVVGASRLYLGAHWLSDVLGGYALGALWFSVLMAVLLWRRGRTRRVPLEERPPEDSRQAA
jgi:undecaprenyl-diphosphatase